MSDYDNTLFQALMDKAYDRWNAPGITWTKQEFWDQLNANERIAVHCGNFNQQVTNGGFSQWWCNNYAVPENVAFLLRLLPKVGTPATKKAAELIEAFWELVDQQDYDTWVKDNGSDEEWSAIIDESDPMCDEYYKIDDQFIQDIEAYLHTL